MPDKPDREHNHHHAYDAADISPKNFLLAVMRDETVDIMLRIDAASKALALTSPPAGTSRVDPDLVIKVPALH